MVFDGAASEPVNAAELSCVKSPATASERQAVTISLRMPLCAHRSRSFFAPELLEDVDYSVGHEPALDVRIGERDQVTHSNVLRRDGAIEREAADRDGGLHRAGIDGHRLVAEDRERNVCKGEGDGGPREEAHRHLARRLEET